MDGGGAGGGKIIGNKGTKDLTDTKAAYQASIDRQETMHKNYADALATGSQQAMLSLVANHIGMTLSAQKGARINQAVWNEAIASAPWVETIAAKWFHRDETGDYIFDGYKGGVTLTKDQMDQMVKLADEKVGTLKDHIDRLQAERTQSQGQGQGPKKRHSIDTAMQLPINKGKTREQVKADLEAHGYEAY